MVVEALKTLMRSYRAYCLIHRALCPI